MDREEQLQFIDEALVQSASDDLQTLHAYWRAGDAEAIWDEMGADMRDRNPKLYRHINVERNDAWVPKIEQMLAEPGTDDTLRSEAHTSELQSLMRNSYAVVC